MNLPIAAQPRHVMTGEPFCYLAADGYALGGFAWRHPHNDVARAVVIINAATSVRCRHYSRFAEYLFANGFDAITYDYRGIGESRRGSLRGFKASWSDWGVLDFEAMLQKVQREFPGQPIDVVGHSFGGCAAGLAASGVVIRRLVSVGAQFAYWRDYARASRWQMLLKWHVAMPLVTLVCGYFPGKRLGWLEDTPAGVVRDWCTPTPRYEQRPSGRHLSPLPFSRVKAKILAISLTDDPFGTVAAINRLLDYFTASECHQLRISPEEIDETEVGHFAFFRSQYQHRLWPIALEWLRKGSLPSAAPGQHSTPEKHPTK